MLQGGVSDVELLEAALAAASKDLKEVLIARFDNLSFKMEDRFASLEANLFPQGPPLHSPSSPGILTNRRPGRISSILSGGSGRSERGQEDITASLASAGFAPGTPAKRGSAGPGDLSLPLCDDTGAKDAPAPGTSSSTVGRQSTNFASNRSFVVRTELQSCEELIYMDEEMNNIDTTERSKTIEFGNPVGPPSEEDMRTSKAAKYMLKPSSSGRLAWDLIGLALIGYDLLFIPYQLAFTPENTLLFRVMFWVALCFWTCDFVLSFFTGFYVRGAEELRPHKVWRNYLAGWFGFDMFIIATDWVSWVADEGRAPAMARMGKSLRILRIVRSLRLLRLVKLQKMIERVMDHIESEHFIILIGMIKGTCFVLGMNHIIACSWYGISILTTDNTDAWLRHADFDEDTSLAHKYLTSLHWSLTQFTPASMEVVPRNVHERLFAVCVLVFALLVFSSFLSSITASMTQLRQLSWKFDKNLSLLRKYLRTHVISAGLSIRILRYVEYKLAKKTNEIRESDVHLLSILSHQLHMELVQETYEPMMVKHPFLRRYAETSSAAMRELCNKATQRVSYSVGDMVFVDKKKAEKMMFLLSGNFEYQQRAEKDNLLTMKPEEWCSEAALWTEWEHQGAMRAGENSEVLKVDSNRFVEVTRGYRRVLDATLNYSDHYVEWLNGEAMAKNLSDLHILDKASLESMVVKSFTEDGLPPTQRQFWYGRRASQTQGFHGTAGVVLAGLGAAEDDADDEHSSCGQPWGASEQLHLHSEDSTVAQQHIPPVLERTDIGEVSKLKL